MIIFFSFCSTCTSTGLCQPCYTAPRGVCYLKYSWLLSPEASLIHFAKLGLETVDDSVQFSAPSWRLFVASLTK